jgi:hypothetical protein
MEAYRGVVRRVAARHPGRVQVLDLAGWVAAHGDARLRPDGVHFTDVTATEVAAWLGPELRARWDAR